jgi:hypothetical protein
MNRAGAALCDTASEFRAGKPEHITQNPEQRHIGRHVDAA